MINIGLVGSGYAAQLHCNGYKKVSGIQVRIKTVCDIDEQKARKMAENFNIEVACKDFEEILKDEEIDIVDICTPPFLHGEMIKNALSAGKHVICEKPLTGYFGRPGDPRPVGRKVPKSVMYERVVEELAELKKIVEKSDKLFMYAENYVYCPTVLKAGEIIAKKKSKILFMKGEESLSGSSSPVAGYWSKTGGGSLIRIGCHPLGGILWLKQREAAARGEVIGVRSVCCDTGSAVFALQEQDKRYIRANPFDVEDTACAVVTFSDGTKALVIAADTVLGGTNNYLQVYADDVALHCNITPSGNMSAYFLDEEGLQDVQIAEMLSTYLGWQNVFVADEVLRGYAGELQDFVECVALNRKPLSDFWLACETVKVIYAAYWAADEGRRIDL